jgi:hypothetical protein
LSPPAGGDRLYCGFAARVRAALTRIDTYLMNKRPTLKLKSAPAPSAAPKLRPSYHPDLKPVLQPGFQADLKHDSLAFCLLGAANAVAQVRAGTALPQALAKVFAQSDAPAQTRGAMQDIAYRTMRQLGRSETLIGLMTSKAPEPPMLAALLCCALALISGEPDALPYEAFTVVDQAVTAAAAHPDLAHAKGMVNAVLRRFLRERAVLLQAALREPQTSREKKKRRERQKKREKKNEKTQKETEKKQNKKKKKKRRSNRNKKKKKKKFKQ